MYTKHNVTIRDVGERGRDEVKICMYIFHYAYKACKNKTLCIRVYKKEYKIIFSRNIISTVTVTVWK